MSAESVSTGLGRTLFQSAFQKFSTAIRRLRASASAWPRLQFPVIAAVAALLGGRLLRLTSRYAVNIFFGDQWGFNDASLFQQHSWWQAFRWVYGPHRLGLGPVVEKLLYPWMRWNSRWESFFICGIMLLATAAALELKYRLFGCFSYADVIVPLVFLSPVSYEAIFGNADLAHGSLPLLLATGYGLAWTVRRQPWRYLLVLLINFLMIYTGFALFMGVITPLALLADWWLHASGPEPLRPWHTGAAIFVALGSLASFFWDYKLMSATCSPFPLRSAGQYFVFMALLFANFIGLTQVGTAAILAGGSLLCLLAMALAVGIKQVLWRAPQTRLPRFVGMALMGYCLLFCANAAFGRICLGLPAAFTSRYMMYLMAGLLGLYLFLLSARRAILRQGGTLVLLAVALLASATVHRRDRNLMRAFYTVKHAWKECLSIEDVPQCDAITRKTLRAGLPSRIYFHPDILQKKVQFLRSHRLNLYADEK